MRNVRGLGSLALVLTGALSLAACGSDDEPAPSNPVTDTGVSDAAGDSAPPTDTGVEDSAPADSGDDTGETGPGITEKTLVTPLSTSQHDRLFGVTFDAAGNIYATGVVYVSADDSAFVVAKFKSDGTLDGSFGTGGVATKNVIAAKGGEVARGIVVQSTGKIVIAGAVEHAGATDERDRDIALVRFDASGAVDTTFGTDGVVILDLSDGELVGSSYVADSHWGLAAFSNDDLLVTGAQKASGRTDTDFAVVKLTKDGARDTTFGTDGVATVDVENASASPRSTTILADGSSVTAGYMRDVDNVVRPVLFKLKADGTLDSSFGTGGVFAKVILGAVAEAYGAALQGSNFVTVGYGRSSTSESLDFLSIRVLANGTHDTSYGTGGHTRVDVNGFNDNGRALVVLPDDRVLMVGGGRNTETDSDGYAALLTKDGIADTTFGPKGLKKFDFGGTGDFLWGAAIAPSKDYVALVGLRSGAAASANDDSVLVILPMPK